MRIFVFGSSIVSAYWNGAATYYRGVFRALNGLGHEIHFCEPDIFDRQANRDLVRDPDYVKVRIYRSDAELEALQAEAAGADLVVKCSGVGARDAELEAWLAGVSGPLRAYWDVDAAHTLDRIEGDDVDPMRRWIPRYDLVFTYGGGPPVVQSATVHSAPGRATPSTMAWTPTSIGRSHRVPPTPVTWFSWGTVSRTGKSASNAFSLPRPRCSPSTASSWAATGGRVCACRTTSAGSGTCPPPCTTR